MIPKVELLFPYVRAVRLQTREDFCKEYPHPGLLIATPRAPDRSPPFDTDTTLRLTPELLETLKLSRPDAYRYRLVMLSNEPVALTVGRDEACDIVLKDPTVSNMHARFEFEPPALLSITDLGSSNGTRVGTRTLPPHQKSDVAAGDRVQLGALALNYVLPPQLYALLSALAVPRS